MEPTIKRRTSKATVRTVNRPQSLKQDVFLPAIAPHGSPEVRPSRAAQRWNERIAASR